MFDTRKLYNNIVEHIINKLQTLNADRKVAFYIRAFHVNLPMYLIIFLIYGPQWLSISILIGLTISFVSLIIFKGCILSKLEKKLDGEDIIIVDPTLSLLGFELNNSNRFKISIVSGILYYYLSMYIYYTRFITVDHIET